MLGLQVGSESLGIGAGVPLGVSAAILIGGTNDMSTNQDMGARWTVRDPDGVVVDSYEDFELFWTGPGLEQGFVGNQFILDKPGTYTMRADLLMNPDDPVTVDSYDGALCVVTTELPPGYELLEETIYPYAYIYGGPHDGGAFTFKTDLFTPASWIAGRLAAACEDEVRKAGGRMLEMRVYVDKSPLLWSDWRIEVVTAPAGDLAGVGMSMGIAWWAVAILAALAIALIIIITWAAKEIAGLFKQKPGLEDVKPAWGKETLIGTIQDAEEYWERSPTPIETLEGMAEPELREYLDAIADEEVTPEILPWSALALVGGLGILGVGAAFVLGGRRD